MWQVHKKRGGQIEQALGRSRGGFTTKVHITVDGIGYPLRLRVTAGQRHDIMQAVDLIEGLPFERVIADRGYASQDFVDWLTKNEIEYVIPLINERKNRVSTMSGFIRIAIWLSVLLTRSSIFGVSFLVWTS